MAYILCIFLSSFAANGGKRTAAVPICCVDVSSECDRVQTTSTPLSARLDRANRALFVCAAPEDAEACQWLAMHLRDNMVRVLWAPEHRAGDWKRDGPPAGFRQCTTFVLLLSPASASSDAVGDQVRWASVSVEEEPHRLLLALPGPTRARPDTDPLEIWQGMEQWLPVVVTTHGKLAGASLLAYSPLPLLTLPALAKHGEDVPERVHGFADPARYNTLMAYGRAHLWWNNLPAALRCFEQAATVRGTAPAAQHCRGLVLARLGRLPAALEAFDAALPHEDVDSRDTTLTTLVEKGSVLRQLGRYHDALHVYRERLEFPPTDGRTWYGHAAAASKLGKVSDVALGLMQGLSHVLLYGTTEVDAHDDVLDAHDSLARDCPSHIAPQLIQVSRALIEHTRGKSDAALAVCHAIRTELSTETPSEVAGAAWAAEAAILRDLGRYHDATELLTQAIRHVGENNGFLTRLQQEVAHPLQALV